MMYTSADIRTAQATLAEAIEYREPDTLSRRTVSLRLSPAPAGSGIQILRRDVDVERGLITPDWHHLVEVQPVTILSNAAGTHVRGIEPLLFALRVCGIDNLLIEIDHDELPECETGVEAWLGRIRAAGLQTQHLLRYGIWMRGHLEVHQGEGFALIRPCIVPSLTIELRHDVFSQYCRPITLNLIDREVTSTLNDFSENLRNRIHDCLSILALTDVPLFGQVYCYNPDIDLCHALLEQLRKQRDTWCYQSYAAINRLTGGILDSISSVSGPAASNPDPRNEAG